MMLQELHIRDVALIEEAWLELGSGMTVLTGETGAGKTVLLGALQLLLGERADASLVRSGASEALVEGRFGSEDDETAVRRRVSADGRSRCTLDGEMATVGLLSERIGPLVDLHGQHEHQALLSASTHLYHLDAWASDAVGPALEQYRACRAAWRECDTALRGLEERMAEASRDVDRLRRLVDEVAAVEPRPNEDTELQARLPALTHAGRLAEVAFSAADLLRGEEGALDRIAESASVLARVSGIDPALDAIAVQLAEASAIVDDAGASVRAYRDGIDHDPAALDSALSRLASLSGLMRTYGPTLDGVIARRDEALDTLAAVSDGSEALTAARDEVRVARRELEEAAGVLASARVQAAPVFCGAVGAIMAELAMDGARIEVAFSEMPFEAWTDHGPHKAEFLYAPAASQPARSLARIASGGEVSRVMLALKGVATTSKGAEVLVFDEVDAGIGGSTATAVGARLASLADTHQVIVVTHLAQVAAFADTHFVVRRISEDGHTLTAVVPVEGEARVDEVARMLSGDVSPESRAHAARLLAR